MGLTLSDFEFEPVGVWEENWRAVMFFARLSTQWRFGGMGSATGLDYTAALTLLRTLRLPREEADALFDDVQVMEQAAMDEMATSNASA